MAVALGPDGAAAVGRHEGVEAALKVERALGQRPGLGEPPVAGRGHEVDVREARVRRRQLKVRVERVEQAPQLLLPRLGPPREAHEGRGELHAEAVVARARGDAQLAGDGPPLREDGVGGCAGDVVGDAGACEASADLVQEARDGFVVAAAAADDEAELDAKEKIWGVDRAGIALVPVMVIAGLDQVGVIRVVVAVVVVIMNVERMRRPTGRGVHVLHARQLAQ